MLRFSIVFFLLSLGLTSVNAQDIQWASYLVDGHSGLSEHEYSPQQALGEPNVYPAAGPYPSAWMSIHPNLKRNKMHVGFANPETVAQLVIFETFNPGSITTIHFFDTDGIKHKIAEFEPKPVSKKSRILHVFMNETSYKVKGVEIMMDGHAVKGYNAIDAIGISKNIDPIDYGPKLNEKINPELEKEVLTEAINSQYDEIKPLVSPDGHTLYFSRAHHPDNMGGEDDLEDIWYAEWDSAQNNWGEAQNAGYELNNKDANYICAITTDSAGNEFFMLGNAYSENEKHSKQGFSITKKSNDSTMTFDHPENHTIDDYYNYSALEEYHLGSNNRVLLMSMERKDGEGENDLYVSFRKDSTNGWSKPMNIGKQVNTAGEEVSPYLAADNKTLYFSTDGRSGYGGKDIFVTRRLDDSWKNWSEPENLGPNINTETNDMFFTMPASGDFAYYCISDSVGNNLDIYRLFLPEFYKPEPVVLLKGYVINQKTGEKMGSTKIVYQDLETGETVGDSYTKKDGSYEIILPFGKKYSYLPENEEYISVHNNLDLTMITEYQEMEKDLYLVPAQKEQVVIFNNVFFDFNDYSLRSESALELDRLASFLKKNTGRQIEISGHADNIGDDAYNKALSAKRAKSVKSYLVSKGVDSSSIKDIGYGEEKPIATNDTEEGRQKNRRVEFKFMN